MDQPIRPHLHHQWSTPARFGIASPTQFGSPDCSRHSGFPGFTMSAWCSSLLHISSLGSSTERSRCCICLDIAWAVARRNLIGPMLNIPG